jgi:hypothetical protein
MLSKAISEYQFEVRTLQQQTSQTSSRGKPFEKVVAAALLLYARSNTKIIPEVFCRKDFIGSEVTNKRLIGVGGSTIYAAKIVWWDNIDEFPPHREDGETKVHYMKRIQEKITG